MKTDSLLLVYEQVKRIFCIYDISFVFLASEYARAKVVKVFTRNIISTHSFLSYSRSYIGIARHFDISTSIIGYYCNSFRAKIKKSTLIIFLE
jgi:hypothetical protein